jgi:hypothetical protein
MAIRSRRFDLHLWIAGHSLAITSLVPTFAFSYSLNQCTS